jgi:hypothetical protein
VTRIATLAPFAGIIMSKPSTGREATDGGIEPRERSNDYQQSIIRKGDNR